MAPLGPGLPQSTRASTGPGPGTGTQALPRGDRPQREPGRGLRGVPPGPRYGGGSRGLLPAGQPRADPVCALPLGVPGRGLRRGTLRTPRSPSAAPDPRPPPSGAGSSMWRRDPSRWSISQVWSISGLRWRGSPRRQGPSRGASASQRGPARRTPADPGGKCQMLRRPANCGPRSSRLLVMNINPPGHVCRWASGST